MDHSKSRKLSKIKKNIFTTHRSHFFYFQKWRNFRKGVVLLRTCQVRHIANMMGPHKACLKLLWEACKHVQVAKLRKKVFWAQENCKRVPKICTKLKHLRLIPRGCCQYHTHGCLCLHIDANTCYSTSKGVCERSMSKN